MKRSKCLLKVCFLAALFSLTLLAGERPNIIIFLADDFGYSSVEPYRVDPADPTNDFWDADYVHTPAVNKLAAEGMLFTDANTPSSVCSPTRYALLTGRYDWRTGKSYGTYGTLSPLAIESGRPTVQGMLKQQGYKTAHIGKWHLGYQNSRTDYQQELTPGPLDIGFDYHWGIPSNNGDTTGVWVENRWVYGLNMDPLDPEYIARPAVNWMNRPMLDIPATFREDDKAMDVMLGKAEDWIRDNSSDPFFMYYAFSAVHIPITPGAEFQGSSPAGPYGDFVHEIDHSVGTILNLLNELKVADNTIVIFTSDNGWDFYNNYNDHSEDVPDGFKLGGDFRGSKHVIWQGGFRVPYIVRWPGHMAPGTTCDQMMNLVDTYATLAAALEVDLPPVTEGAEDSYNFLPAWLGEDEAPIRDHMILTSSFGTVAVRKDGYKFINGVPTNRNIDPDTVNDRLKPEFHRQVYNLADDPFELAEIDPTTTTIDEDLEQVYLDAAAAGHTRKTPVTLTVSSPADASKFFNTEDVTVTAQASHPSGIKELVLSYMSTLDGTSEELTASEGSHTWTLAAGALPVGVCWLRVRAVPVDVDAESVTQEITIEITPEPGDNTLPTITLHAAAEPVSITTAESTVLKVVAEDSTGDLTYTWAALSAPEAASFTPNGTLASSTSKASFTTAGIYELTVVVSDGNLSVSSQVTVTVVDAASLNEAPTANSQQVTTSEGVAIAILLEGNDPDSSPQPLAYNVMEGPNNGELSGDIPNLTYTPNVDFSGTDSFTFNVTDGADDSDAATVDIAVSPVDNENPGTLQKADDDGGCGGCSTTDNGYENLWLILVAAYGLFIRRKYLRYS